MSIYGIPPQVIPGFQKIIALDEKQIKTIGIIFSDIELGESLTDAIEKVAPQTGLSIHDVELIVRSLISLTDIYFESKDAPEKFSEDFTESFSEQGKISNKEELDGFKRNITSLTSLLGTRMRAMLKTKEVIRENPNNFYEARIVSDIRVVYDDDNNLDKQEQLAVVVHNLRIRYTSNATPRGEIFVALDLADLHQLQGVIRRAIEKDKLLRSNTHNLTFVDPKF